MSVLSFDDEIVIPTKSCKSYSSPNDNDVPIVIDNGTYHCKAGFASDFSPFLNFKNIVCRQKGKQDIIGNDIHNVEIVRWQIRSPFERNLITQYDLEEKILDYIFENLSIYGNRVGHPILMTEAIFNPNYCRKQMNELLFECYNVPQVCYGIDSMFSFYNELPFQKDAFVISIGYSCTHIIPILDGNILFNNIRRINVGSAHVDFQMLRLVQLAHPNLSLSMNLSRAEYLVRKHARVALSYREEISKWESNDYYNEYNIKYQLPFTAQAPSNVNSDESKKKKEVQADRLRQMNIRRRRAKLEEDVQKLNKLINIQEMEENDDSNFIGCLHELGLASKAELGHEINKLNNSINAARSKLEDFEFGKKPNVQTKRLIPDGDIINYVKDLKGNKLNMIEKREKRRQHRVESAKRRTHASQKRMRILSELAAGQGKKADTFGQDDDDWNVYKEINKDVGHSDSEEEQMKLDEIENLLREYDPDYISNHAVSETDIAEYYRLNIATEQIRAPEVLFQPAAILGVDQAGISSASAYILTKLLNKQEMERCIKCVYITGGCVGIPGFKERVQKDLMQELPWKSDLHVLTSNDPIFSAFKGACKWSNTAEYRNSSIDSKSYQENGHDYLKYHSKSNYFFKLKTIDVND